jgi:hypothetical protein
VIGMFYVLKNDMRLVIVGTAQDRSSRSPDKYLEGRDFAEDDLPIEPSVSVEVAPERYPDYFELQGVPIVSTRLVEALRGAGVVNFKTYDAPIVDDTGTTGGHCFLNVLGRVACLDRARTKATEYRGRLVRVKSLAIEESRASGQDLFRLHEKESLILVSSRVHAALAGLSGAVLKPAQGWSDQDRF